MKLSLVIPAKEKDAKLFELLASIDAQDFPKKELEVLVITEGTSESAKAIGIRRAKGEVIGFLASDNELVEPNFLTRNYDMARLEGASECCYYHYNKNDNVLNRYFSLFGFNDPLAFYMNKCDRLPRVDCIGPLDRPKDSTIGDNGYFVQKSLIENTDLDNYYHIDNAIEAGVVPFPLYSSIWHKTGGNIFKFFAKRYRYGLQHTFNSNRRWHLVDFKKRGDILKLIWFILAAVTFIHPLVTAMRGYSKIRDIAWFIHPVICFLTVVTYGILVCHLFLRRMFQSLFAHSEGTLA